MKLLMQVHSIRNFHNCFLPILSFIFIVLAILLIRVCDCSAQNVDDLHNSQLTLDVRDADLQEVFRFLADKAGINILISPKVKGTITCRVLDMDPLELIFYIARTNGLTVEDHGHILLILTEDSKDLRMRIEVISLQNAKAADVAKMIETIKIDKHTKVTHDERTNRLIVTYEDNP